jgi:hypothetical protein
MKIKIRVEWSSITYLGINRGYLYTISGNDVYAQCAYSDYEQCWKEAFKKIGV